MEKIYHVVATEYNTETDETNEVLNDSYEGFTLYGGKGDTFEEVIFNENIMGLAAKLIQSTKGRVAVKLAVALDAAKGSMMEDLEDDLIDIIGGTKQ